MTKSFREIQQCFYDFGLDLITTQTEFEESKLSEQEYVFVFRGPCGHVRQGHLPERVIICKACMSTVTTSRYVHEQYQTYIRQQLSVHAR